MFPKVKRRTRNANSFWSSSTCWLLRRCPQLNSEWQSDICARGMNVTRSLEPACIRIQVSSEWNTCKGGELRPGLPKVGLFKSAWEQMYTPRWLSRQLGQYYHNFRVNWMAPQQATRNVDFVIVAVFQYFGTFQHVLRHQAMHIRDLRLLSCTNISQFSASQLNEIGHMGDQLQFSVWTCS